MAGGSQYCGTAPTVFTSAPEYRTWLYDVVRGVPGTPSPVLATLAEAPIQTLPDLYVCCLAHEQAFEGLGGRELGC